MEVFCLVMIIAITIIVVIAIIISFSGWLGLDRFLCPKNQIII